MSHHDSVQRRIPKAVALSQPLPQLLSTPSTSEPKLLVAGQGCVTFTLAGKPNEARISFLTNDEKSRLIFNFSKSDSGIRLSYQDNGGQETKFPKFEMIKSLDGYTAAIDPNPKCVYWISIDSINKIIRYGKGEMRLSTVLAESRYKDLDFIKKIEKISADDSIVKLAFSWKDPITVEPPAFVVPMDKFTMNDAATQWDRENPKPQITTPKALSKECQELYGNVAGENFSLNAPDFPDFEQALEYSIRTEGCIAYKIIKEKLHNHPLNAAPASNLVPQANPEYKGVYLRITMGKAQGNSPGVPYVMEIWPSGCGSPIHNHGMTNAIIKVLRGEIEVDIFRMLPAEGNPQKPLGTVTFGRGDVTYLMPQANQFHRLRNNIKNTHTCITIQCYAYSSDDENHYPYFDYIKEDEEHHFDPVSDCDFIEFKATIKKEWETYLSKLPCLE